MNRYADINNMGTLINIISDPVIWILSAAIVISYIAEHKLKTKNKK